MPFVGLAEESEARINGSVKDPDGAVVSGASVSLVNTERAVIASTTTDAQGRFTLEPSSLETVEILRGPDSSHSVVAPSRAKLNEGAATECRPYNCISGAQ